MSQAYGERHDGDGQSYRAIRHIQAQPKQDMPAILSMDAVNDSGVITTWHEWWDSNGDKRAKTGILPTNQDDDGDVISGAASGADVNLSNVTSTAIPVSLISDAANTDDLGTDAKPWKSARLGTSLIFVQTTRNLTITASEPGSSARTVNFPDPGGNESVAYLAATQTFTTKSMDGDNNTFTNLPANQLKIASQARGDILQRGATAWKRLGAGAAGLAIVSAGAGADVYWGTPNVGTATALANTVDCEAGTNDYTLDFGTAGGAYTLTIPAVAGSRSFSFIDQAENFSAVKTFDQTSLVIKGGDANAMTIKCDETLTGAKTLNIKINDTNRTIDIGGNLTTAGDVIFAGAFNITTTLQNTGTFVFADASAFALTFPTGTDVLVARASADTLTNKTLTAPIIVSGGYIADADGDELLGFTEDTTPVNFVNITSGDTGVMPIIGTGGSDADRGLMLIGKGTGLVTIADAATPTKMLDFELIGATATKTMTIVSSHTNDHSLTLPDATDTLVGKATVDTFTYKTLDADGTGNVLSNINGDELDPIAADVYGIPIIWRYNLANDATPVELTTNSPFKFLVIDAWSVNKSADGGSWKLDNGTNDLHSAVTVAASDDDVDRVVDFDDTYTTIAATETLRITPDSGGALDCDVYIMIVRIE